MAEPANFRRPVRKLGDSVNAAATSVVALLYAFRLVVTNNSMMGVLQGLFEMPGGALVEVNFNQLGKIYTLDASDEDFEAHASKINEKIVSLSGFDASELLERATIEDCLVGEDKIKSEVRYFNQDLFDATVSHLKDHPVDKLPIKMGRDGYYEIDQSRSSDEISDSNKASRAEAEKRIATAKRKASAAAKKK